MNKPLCFVVMGFGKKTDYSKKPRTLDLNATYEAIIKPAVDAAGLECIRADEVTHSGMIDKPMYEMLLRADLVIADISTANPNALYELGVRHALKPFSTIVMKEVDGTFHFDLNHLATLQYKHLGDDIGSREKADKVPQLKKLIEAVLVKKEADSPVYTFLAGLQQPTMTSEEFAHAVATIKAQSDSLCQELDAGRAAAAASKHAEARDHFQRAYDIQANAKAGSGSSDLPDSYIIQQLALHTYKAGVKTAEERNALEAGWKVIEQLSPATSTDPETLGIAGAIRKRLFTASAESAHLDAAIELYGRGFEVKRDYYNGENYALCLDLRAPLQSDAGEADYDRRTAKKVRDRVVASLEPQLQDKQVADRPDHKWMLATMANTLRALGRNGDAYEKAFLELKPVKWEIDTFEGGKAYALKIAAGPTATP